MATPLYQQFLDVPPPQRFAVTVRAYLAAMQAINKTWSGRKISTSSGLSPSYYNVTLTRIDRGEGSNRFNVPSLVAVVETINSAMPGDQVWPVEAAIEAAGLSLDGYRGHLHQGSRKNGARDEEEYRDTLPYMRVALPLPILDLDDVRTQGLGASVNTREVLNMANNMALMRNPIPGYTAQKDGEWALIQDRSAKVPEGVWALVRENGQVYAHPRKLLGQQQKVLAWIIGTLRVVQEQA